MKLSIALTLAATIAMGVGSANADGSGVFVAHCAICHQVNAQGVPGVYPPLANSVGNYVRVKEGRSYLVHVVSFGMDGSMTIRDQSYSGFMPPLPELGDAEVAEVLNQVLTGFDTSLLPKDFAPLTADEVKKYRARELSANDVYEERNALLKKLKDANPH